MIKKIFILCLFILISCKTEVKKDFKGNSIKKETFQEVNNEDSFSQKEDNLNKVNTDQFIGKKLDIDLDCLSNDGCKSNTLDMLFKKENYDYFLGDYRGTSQEEYYCYVLGLFKNSEHKDTYVLFFDNNDILRDTLRTTDKKISLNVEFDDNQRGLALGYVDTKNLKNIYFEITNLYQIDNNIKLQEIGLNMKIKNCPLPLDYLSEEYVEIEEYFNYDVKK